MINYTYRMLGGGRNLMYGAKLTILLTTITVFFGLILGTLLSLGKISKFKPLSKVCSGYIFFFRGTPLLIQLFVVYFTLPKLFDFSWTGLFSAYGHRRNLHGFVPCLVHHVQPELRRVLRGNRPRGDSVHRQGTA